jgi:hypothetical protein
MYSCCYQGKVLDFHYKAIPSCNAYNFYIDDILIGQIFKMGKHNWTGISFHENAKGSMGGFGTRFHASEYLLILTGFQRKS